jgi:hypothetical protein
MIYVSIILEFVRARPRLVFWLTALTQAALWWLVPVIFYAAPPGELPLTLAAGHEFQLGSLLGPPLAGWIADATFVIAGMPGVYLLSQVCVIVTYWAVFTLGRAVVGASHAALAVMLMVGIAVMSISTPEFGPAVLAMPLIALLMLHFWRAIGEGRRSYWLAVGVETGLLLMTSYAGFIPCLMLVLFTAGTRRGREQLLAIEPWMAAVIAVILMFPHLIWLTSARDQWQPELAQMFTLEAFNANLIDWLKLLARVIALHTGMVVMIVLAIGWKLIKREQRVPVFARPDIEAFSKLFVYYHALTPLLLASIVSVVIGQRGLFGGAAPLVVLSGLAAIVFAGNAIAIHRQHMVVGVWLSWLIAPPLLAALGILTLPWIAGTDLQVTRPARALGAYFAENFTRRTGRPLEIVAGDPEIASLVALYAKPRARLYLDQTPEKSPWIKPKDIAESGTVVLWTAQDTAGAPPANIRERFPNLAPDVPRAFERTVQGRTPLMRIGWGVLRPNETAPAAPATTPIR